MFFKTEDRIPTVILELLQKEEISSKWVVLCIWDDLKKTIHNFKNDDYIFLNWFKNHVHYFS